MTIPYLSGNADPRVLEGIKKSAQEIGDPNKAAREALLAAMSRDAKLKSQWADQYIKNPEAVRKMFGRQVDKFFKGDKTSAEGLVENRATKLLEDNTSIEDIDKGTGALDVAASAAATGQTPLQRAQARATLDSTQTNVDIAKLNKLALEADAPFFESGARARNTLAQNQALISSGQVDAMQAQQTYQQRVAAFGTKYGNTPELIYDAYRSGKMEHEDMVAAMAVPETAKLIEFQQQEYWRKQEMQLRKDLEAGKYESPDHVLRNADILLARQLAEKSFGKYSATTLYNLKQNPAELKKYMEMETPPVDGVEAARWEAARFLVTEQQRNQALLQARAQAQADAANSSVYGIATDVKKPFDQRKAAIQIINQNNRLILGEQGYPYEEFELKPNGIFGSKGAGELLSKETGGAKSSDIDIAAQKLASGEGTDAELTATTAFTAAEKATIRTKAAQLKANKK